ncbi:type III secretion system ATPase SctN [Pleionea sediminis]|uniref:type III secretion system ATPase SctN n=1 Tax=Pleionea sediminis TaxID=2569479 RepID=UPI002482E625|nr:type III secretion system ATPase SctN [Pleionea sediminis]
MSIDYKQVLSQVNQSLDESMVQLEEDWENSHHRINKLIAEQPHCQKYGNVIKVSGTIIHATIGNVKVGEICELKSPSGEVYCLSEVVGLDGSQVLLSPLGPVHGLSNKTMVVPTGRPHLIDVGDHLLGSVVDGLGNIVDHGSEPNTTRQSVEQVPVTNASPDPLTRKLVDRPISLGIKAIDGMLTCGEGQRMGIFAAAGGGKSTLLGMMVRNASADVVVIALIGERGREVREFLDHDLGEEGRKKSCVVVATSDKTSMERAKAPLVATSIAEYFRDQGKKVLLLMDSVTRYARALREIGLAAGEPPTRRGFPPSVFAALPQLMERAGQSDKSSITAFYTVLVEGDDMTEPVADETRSILDGHIILSRDLASAAHYPAIDILASVSRVMGQVSEKHHSQAANQIRSWMAKYKEIELLVRIGEYEKGNDPEADKAKEKIDQINAFLKQGTHDVEAFEQTLSQLVSITQ